MQGLLLSNNWNGLHSVWLYCLIHSYFFIHHFVAWAIITLNTLIWPIFVNYIMEWSTHSLNRDIVFMVFQVKRCSLLKILWMDNCLVITSTFIDINSVYNLIWNLWEIRFMPFNSILIFNRIIMLTEGLLLTRITLIWNDIILNLCDTVNLVPVIITILLVF